MNKSEMTEQKPNSRIEKNKQWEDKKVLERWMYVHELRALLDNLNDDDWITPNCSNLVIGRGDKDKDGLGIIDFYWNRIDWFQMDSGQAGLE